MAWTGAVLHALGVFALLAMLDGELAVAEEPSPVSPDFEVIVIPHAHAGGMLAYTTVVAQRTHIISQRWQPEQRARSVTIILVEVVRSTMRARCDGLLVTPQLASAPPATKPANRCQAMASTVTTGDVLLDRGAASLDSADILGYSALDILVAPLPVLPQPSASS